MTRDTNNIDTHMMKNMEWGVVAYLLHSKYVIDKEINVSISNITGQSSGTTDGSSSNYFLSSKVGNWSITIHPLLRYYDSMYSFVVVEVSVIRLLRVYFIFIDVMVL